MQAAHQLGREAIPRLIMFSSLSKRSNVAGLALRLRRRGCGDPEADHLYRTYHGGAMPPANFDGQRCRLGGRIHVVENRRLYREKFATALEILGPMRPKPKCRKPLSTCGSRRPVTDTEFARALYAAQGVSACSRAAFSAAKRTERIPARTACASRSWPRPRSAPMAAERIRDFWRRCRHEGRMDD
jgi:N-succinyldiaminopimelate aminotransferase